MKIVNTIRKNYAIPKAIASFSGLTKQKQKYGRSISSRNLRKELQSISAYTLHRERKSPRKRNPFFIYKKRQQVQIDLIDISSLAPQNDNVRFLFSSIDMFTKKAYLQPMTDKRASSTVKAIELMLIFYEQAPEEILSDRGTEFKNSLVSKFLNERKIRHRFTNSDIKCAGVERFNKTIQGKIYIYLTHNKTLRYIDKLDDLVSSYNATPHTTIELSPNRAEIERFGEFVRGKLFEFYTRGSLFQQRKKFRPGDFVRISINRSKFQRSYGKTQKYEIFEIESVNEHLPIPMYFIRSLYDGEVIEGGFYESELVPVQCLRIKILKKKGARTLVQWNDDPDQIKSWVDSETIKSRCK